MVQLIVGKKGKGKTKCLLDRVNNEVKEVLGSVVYLDKSTKLKLERGARLVELLKQPQYMPMPTEDQVASMYAATRGFMDDVPETEIRTFERELLDFLHASKADILDDIRTRKTLDDDLKGRLNDAITAFKQSRNA